MRTTSRLAALTSVLAGPGDALAHALGGDTPLALELSHHVASPHHAPLLLSLLAGIALIILISR